jgi:hypothetical protein
MLTSQPGSLTCVSAFFIVCFFTAPACGEVLGGRPPGHTWSLALSLPHAAPSSLILAATLRQSTSRAETTHDGVESTRAAHQQHAVPCMGTKPPAEYAERAYAVCGRPSPSACCARAARHRARAVGSAEQAVAVLGAPPVQRRPLSSARGAQQQQHRLHNDRSRTVHPPPSVSVLLPAAGGYYTRL